MEQANQQTAFQQKITSFSSKGLVLKKDMALLADGEFSEFTNLQSVVEGVLTQRFGHRRITDNNAFGGTNANVIHSIAKLHTSPTQDYFYMGSGEDIFRMNGPLPPPGSFNTLSKVATNCTPPVGIISQLRFTGIRYNSGTVGTPYEFFACPLKMLKDTGTFTNSGDGSSDGITTIQRWGIIPPVAPASAVLDEITILPDTFVIADDASRINTTVASVAGTAPGQVNIVPADMTGIVAGMLIHVGTQSGEILSTSSTNFQIYLGTTPSPGDVVTSGSTTFTASVTPGTTDQFTIAVPGAQFNGIADDGYSTPDLVHISIGIDDPADIYDIRLRVMVNDPTGPDYYEKEILPSQVQSQTSLTNTATTTLPVVSQNVTSGVSGPYNIADPTASTAKAVYLDPVPPDQVLGTPAWSEIDIPKDQFLEVGRAGTGIYTWANVVGFQVVGISSSGTPTIWLGSIYFAGGFGPNAVASSANVPLLPYAYLYTFRNIDTGWESNPCPYMIPQNFISPGRQAVKVTVTSSTDNQVSGAPTAFPTAATQPSAIAIYRSGGAFADNLYRLVGYADNVVLSDGSGAQVTFIDQQSDESIVSSQTITLDNDPPVRSTLPTPFVVGFQAWTVGTGAPGYNTFTVNIISAQGTDFTKFLTVGSVITIAPNTQVQEVTAIANVTPTTISVVLQYDHSATLASTSAVFARVDSVVGQPCNLAVAAFDSLFVAGDPNNPHVLYKSKTGQPEAFPVVELDTGIADQVNVGSPSNPIMNIIEYNGQLLSLNYEDLYLIQVFLGQMQNPIRANAGRGLYASRAYCRVEGEIWFLSYDGIYSWSGGVAVKRSEAIDPLFHGVSIGPYNFIDLSYQSTSPTGAPKDQITMMYSKQRVYIAYVDNQGFYHRLRYDILYDRWCVEDLADPTAPLLNVITAQYTEEDEGFEAPFQGGLETESNTIIAKSVVFSPSSTIGYLYLDDVGTSDGWVTLPTDGAPIPYSFVPTAYTFGSPSFQKQYSDCITEFNNDGGSIQIQTFYDFSAFPDSFDVFSIMQPATPLGRRRQIFSFHNGFGKEAYSMQFRYSGSASSPVTFYTNTFNYFSLDQLQIGRAFDWDDLGCPDDKRLYEVTFWYDAKLSPHTWVLDTIQGIVNNQVVTQDVQEFILEPLGGSFTGPTWTQVTFPINDTILAQAGVANSIVKKVRLRPKLGSGSTVICANDAFTGGVAGQYGNQRWGVYQVGSTLYKTLFEGILAKQLFVEKSTDGGDTWTNVTGSKTIVPGSSVANGVAVAFGSGVIYVLWATSSTTMVVSQFSTFTDSWLADITGLPTLNTTATGSGYGATNMAICVKPNGKLEIIYNGGIEAISSIAYARAYFSEYAAGTWSVGTQFAGQSGIAKDFLASQILASSTNRAHFFLYTVNLVGPNDIYHVTVPDGGVQATFQHLASDASTRVQNFNNPVGLGLIYIDSSSVERIAVPYINGGTATDGSPDFGPSFSNNILLAQDADNPAWATQTVDSTMQISGFQPAFEVLASVAYDVSTNLLYMVWVNPTSYGTPGGPVVSTSGRVMYSTNNGGGWTAPTVFESLASPNVPSGAIANILSPGSLGVLVYKVNSTEFYL